MVFRSKRDGNPRRRHWIRGRRWTSRRKDQPRYLYRKQSSHHDQRAPRYQPVTGIRSCHRHPHHSHSSRVSRICKCLNRLQYNSNTLSRRCSIRTIRGSSPRTLGVDSKWLSSLLSILPTDNNIPSSSSNSNHNNHNNCCRHSRLETRSFVLRDHRSSPQATPGRSQSHHSHSRLQSRKAAIPLAWRGSNSPRRRRNHLSCSNNQWYNLHQRYMDNRRTSSVHRSKHPPNNNNNRATCPKSTHRNK